MAAILLKLSAEFQVASSAPSALPDAATENRVFLAGRCMDSGRSKPVRGKKVSAD